MINWKVYVLESLTSGKHYVGMSRDVTRRLKEHNAGKGKFTSGHRPWKLIYCEEAGEIESARNREKYLKSSAGRKFLEKKITDETQSSPPDR